MGEVSPRRLGSGLRAAGAGAGILAAPLQRGDAPRNAPLRGEVDA
jgi:hypothetical protein